MTGDGIQPITGLCSSNVIGSHIADWSFCCHDIEAAKAVMRATKSGIPMDTCRHYCGFGRVRVCHAQTSIGTTR
jgi:hypothetical protein